MSINFNILLLPDILMILCLFITTIDTIGHIR